MIPNPIRKVLSSMRAHRVRALLMGGQACVFYGAAEFSRDTDLAIVADAVNLARLRQALAELQAAPIAVPPFALKFLRRGHTRDAARWAHLFIVVDEIWSSLTPALSPRLVITHKSGVMFCQSRWD